MCAGPERSVGGCADGRPECVAPLLLSPFDDVGPIFGSFGPLLRPSLTADGGARRGFLRQWNGELLKEWVRFVGDSFGPTGARRPVEGLAGDFGRTKLDANALRLLTFAEKLGVYCPLVCMNGRLALSAAKNSSFSGSPIVFANGRTFETLQQLPKAAQFGDIDPEEQLDTDIAFAKDQRDAPKAVLYGSMDAPQTWQLLTALQAADVPFLFRHIEPHLCRGVFSLVPVVRVRLIFRPDLC